MKVKICGQTTLSDCEMSVRLGADFLGVVVNVGWSARSRTNEEAAPIFEKFADRTFLLTFNEKVGDGYAALVNKLDPYALQLTGQETLAQVAEVKKLTGKPVYKSVHLHPEDSFKDDPAKVIASIEAFIGAGADGFILDTATKGMFGGTGKKSDWELAAKITSAVSSPIFLAGGIDPDNVAKAIATPGIYGVDMASGVEVEKGVKSEEKLRKLFDVIGKARQQNNQ